jgi:hypothetical protein
MLPAMRGIGALTLLLGTSCRAAGQQPPPPSPIGATTVNGRLPPEVIQRIVRQDYGKFRVCYEDGLRRNRDLEGRVTTRFTIGREGRVEKVSLASATLPDSAAVQCVLDEYKKLNFPFPEGGIVTVVYPIMFSRDDSREERNVKNGSRTLQQWTELCSRDAMTCSGLAEMFSIGKEVAANPVRAAELYGRACEAGRAQACTHLGTLYETGNGVAADAAHALEIYQRACDWSDYEGCNHIGVMYEYGKGVAVDAAHASELYRHACDRGLAVGCSNLERLKQQSSASGGVQ